MPLSLDFSRVCGIFAIGGSSHILSKVFRFSLSKVVQTVVKPRPAYAARRSISALAEAKVACA